ncbi:MAG TPA: DPP IV N-terminal domain-containing protein, partial [Pyrinomonadaceae bacterium]
MKPFRLRATLHTLLILTSLLLPRAAAGQAQRQQQQPARFELTVDSIMRGPDLVGYAPTQVVWSQDGARVYFRWKRAGETRLKEPDTYVVAADGTGLRKLSEEEARRQAPPSGGELSKDKKMSVFVEDGDVFLYDHTTAARRQVTRTTDAESNARFTRDGRAVYFTRQNNLFVLSLDGGSLEQLTDVRTGGSGGAAEQRAAGGRGAQRQGGSSGGDDAQRRGTESQEVLKREERALLEAVRERAEQREEQEAKRKRRETRKPFNVPTGQTVANLTLSPDGRFVVAAVSEPASGAKNTIVPNYVTESAYTEDISSRTKVGDTQGRSRLAVISVETG